MQSKYKFLESEDVKLNEIFTKIVLNKEDLEFLEIQEGGDLLKITFTFSRVGDLPKKHIEQCKTDLLFNSKKKV